MSQPARSAATRLRCQVCGKHLIPLKDGTARRHGHHGYCVGSGYRLDLWPVGQVLRHYAGSVWEVVSISPGHYEGMSWMVDYRMRCLSDPHATFGKDQVGRIRTMHGEYMHRHGWRSVEPPEPSDLGKRALRALAGAMIDPGELTMDELVRKMRPAERSIVYAVVDQLATLRLVELEDGDYVRCTELGRAFCNANRYPCAVRT